MNTNTSAMGSIYPFVSDQQTPEMEDSEKIGKHGVLIKFHENVGMGS